MSDPAQFWPKNGEKVVFGRTNLTYKVIGLVDDYPCKRYLLKDQRTGETTRAFRHEIDRIGIPNPVRMNDSYVTDSFLECVDLQFVPDMTLDDFVVLMPEEEVDNDHDDSDLDDEQLDEVQISVNPKTTDKNTNWAMRRFEEWQLKRGLNVDLASIEESELASILRKFYAEVKTKTGKRLTPTSLRGIRAGIQRRITSPPLNRIINIMTGVEFTITNKMFESQCKLYVQLKNPKPKHHSTIEQGDMERVKNYLQPLNTPVLLQQAMWFMLCYLFARRGQEGWKLMTKSSFTVKSDDKGNEYLTTDNTEASKNWQGGSSSANVDYSDVRAYGDPTGSDALNIVTIYKKYRSKLNPNNDSFFQRPKQKFEVAGIWYDNVPIGKNNIGTIMKTISKMANLSAIYTNHCVRSTSITVMYQAGIDIKQICQVSKHKSEESLKHYIQGSTSEQKRFCSDALRKGFPTSSAAINDTVQSLSTDTTSCNTPAQSNAFPTSSAAINETVQPPSTDTISCNTPTPTLSIQSTSINNENACTALVNHSEHTSTATPTTVTQTQQSFRSMSMPQGVNFNVSGGNCNFHLHFNETPHSNFLEYNMNTGTKQ